MDARIDPMDESAHTDLVDLIRRSSFSDGLSLFGRLIKLAHNQGTIDAYVAMSQRVAEVANGEAATAFEAEIRGLRP